MNRNAPNPDDAHLDRLLAGYFQAQLPKTWPQPPIAAVPSSVATRGYSLRNRLTLAACAAAVLGLGVALSYGPITGSQSQPNPDGSFIKNGTADGGELKARIKPTGTTK